MKKIGLNIIALILTGIYILFVPVDMFAQEKSCTDCHSKLINKKIFHAAADDCSNCHSITVNQEHFTKKNDFALNEKMPDLCYMCHEAKNTKKNVHMPAAEGECTICHAPHSSPYVNLLTKSPTSKMCYECHDLDISGKDFLHLPVKEGKCENCHDPHQSDNNKFLQSEKPQLCFNCHEKQKNETNLDYVHPPFDDDCSNCHNSHKSQYKNLLTEKTPTLCFNCHEGQDLIQNSKSVHGVIKDKKSCSNCHSPHASKYNKFLYEENNRLCFSCHNRTIKTEKVKIENISLKIKDAKSVHPPIEIDGCTACHNPHYSENNYLLNLKYPDKRYTEAIPENFALCFECHDSGLLTEQNTTSATNFRNGNKNMHFLHIKGKKGRSCSLCHDIHASGNLHLIKEKSEFGNWEMDMNYKTFNNGGSCFPGCHGEKSYIRE